MTFDWCCENGDDKESCFIFLIYLSNIFSPAPAWNNRAERRNPPRGEKSRLSCRVYGAYWKHFWLAWRKWNLVEGISIRRGNQEVKLKENNFRCGGAHWDGINDFYLFWKKAGMRAREGVTKVLNNFKLCLRTMDGIDKNTAEARGSASEMKMSMKALWALDAFCRCQQISRCPLNFEFVPGDVNNIISHRNL